MIYGRPPFAHLNMISKLQAITNPAFQVPYPDAEQKDPLAMATIRDCLRWEPKSRPIVKELLAAPFAS
jgi:hypothetical protein